MNTNPANISGNTADGYDLVGKVIG